MTQMQFVPPETNRTDVTIGLVVEDQRTGDRRKVVYADDRIVLTRDETGNSTLTPRDTFAGELGSRYRPRPGADPDVDGGPFDQLFACLAAYEDQAGRKASHKADALREAMGLVDRAGDTDEMDGANETTESPDVPFEDLDGIGPETARKLRAAGYVTEADVRRASDDALLAVAGVGPANRQTIREAVD